MNFVELHRWFAPIERDQEIDLAASGSWEKRIYGGKDWSDLLSCRRVVVLAEAASGKSEEFRNQAKILSDQGNSTFNVTIEELHDRGLRDSIGPRQLKQLKQWLEDGESTAWFFLDSIDEARLNRKNFESALKCLARELEEALERANVFISCRITDWMEPEDRRAILEWIPCHRRPARAAEQNEHDLILAPIFQDTRSERDRRQIKETEAEEVFVVQLMPLDRKQSKILAERAGVSDVKEFSDAIGASGLEIFQQRPGDVIDLAAFWMKHGRFDSLLEMVEYGIERKLSERGVHRSDNHFISLSQAREDAERLAAALTLGKSFTLLAPGAGVGSGVKGGAVDTVPVLAHLNDAQRSALLRRGIFAPATYGRIRFHHRTTQEYLTARWLQRLLNAGCPVAEVYHLLFADRYDVKTVIPSIRPTAAWLALWHTGICNEIIQREPVILMQQGDPRSLGIMVRGKLLLSLARRHANGEVKDSQINLRELAMFADARLSDDIRSAWTINNHPDFRFILASLIRDGAVPGCEELLKSILNDPNERVHHRLVALEAMIACNANEAVMEFTDSFLRDDLMAAGPIASGLVGILYPRYISTKDVARIIAASELSEEDVDSSFKYQVTSIYDAAPSEQDREELCDYLSELCLQYPHSDEYRRLSRRYGHLAGYLETVAIKEIKKQSSATPRAGLLKLLMAIERTDRAFAEENKASIRELVASRPVLNRALMWANVADLRASQEGPPGSLVWYWQMYPGFQTRLWSGSRADIEWLTEDAVNLPALDDRRLALSMLFSIINSEGTLELNKERLLSVAESDVKLAQDLIEFMTPPTESESQKVFRLKEKEWKDKNDEKARIKKEKWIKFRAELLEDPRQLCRPENLVSWESGIFRLRDLTYWLERRTGLRDEAAARHWRFLSDAFSRQVAESYRDGMMALWRTVPPRRPIRRSGAGITYKWPQMLAFAGLCVAAAERPRWLVALSETDASRCAVHVCSAEQGCPEWLGDLISAHPETVGPIVRQKLKQEWRSRQSGRSDFFFYYSRPKVEIAKPLQDIFSDVILHREVGNVDTIKYAISILGKIELDSNQRGKLKRAASKGFLRHAAGVDEAYAIDLLGVCLMVSPDMAVEYIIDWARLEEPQQGDSRVARLLSRLFDGHHHGLAVGALDEMSIESLKTLLHFSYYHIRPADDLNHVGSFTPGVRDSAESARGTILGRLVDRPGSAAYLALRKLANDPVFCDRRQRLLELAHGKAERDSEPPAWQPRDVVEFERTHAAPVNSGAALMRVVEAVLQEINHDLHYADVTSRSLLEIARDEDEVRNWLAEQLGLRSRNRFSVYREAVVFNKYRPDIVVASSSAQYEVAIEVKHGGKSYSMKQLLVALRSQLAGQYLKPEARRNGILVLSQHARGSRKHPITGQPLSFEEQMLLLNEEASKIMHDANCEIGLACVGLDAVSRSGATSGIKISGI